MISYNLIKLNVNFRRAASALRRILHCTCSHTVHSPTPQMNHALVKRKEAKCHLMEAGSVSVYRCGVRFGTNRAVMSALKIGRAHV